MTIQHTVAVGLERINLDLNTHYIMKDWWKPLKTLPVSPPSPHRSITEHFLNAVPPFPSSPLPPLPSLHNFYGSSLRTAIKRIFFSWSGLSSSARPPPTAAPHTTACCCVRFGSVPITYCDSNQNKLIGNLFISFKWKFRHGNDFISLFRFKSSSPKICCPNLFLLNWKHWVELNLYFLKILFMFKMWKLICCVITKSLTF